MESIALELVFVLFMIMSALCMFLCGYLAWDTVKRYKVYSKQRNSFDDFISSKERLEGLE